MKTKSKLWSAIIALIIILNMSGCAGKDDYTQKIIAFLRIYPEKREMLVNLLDLATGEERELELPFELSSCPVWSPNGDYLLLGKFSSSPGEAIFYLYNLASGEIEKLQLPEGYQFSSPAWSPDGLEIVLVGMTAYPSERNINLYTYNLEDQNLTQITFETNPRNAWGNPAWSPDGRKILAPFRHNWSSANETSQLLFLNLKDNTETILAEGDSLLGPIFISGASWSPDSRRIVFRERIIDDPAAGRGCSNIILLDTKTMERTSLTDCELYEDNGLPTWSSDGKKIIFASNRDHLDENAGWEKHDLYMMNPDGTDIERLTTTGDTYCPAIQP